MRIKVNSKKAEAAIRRVQAGMSPNSIDRVVARAAMVTHSRVVRQTPKKWTGNTRRAWQIVHRAVGHYRVYNPSKVMKFLEHGTKAHGPKKAKFLFIPLTRRAAMQGARGVFAKNKAAQAAGRKPPFVFGTDFVLSKWVRGIKARKIAEQARPFAELTLKAAMRIHIRNLINS